MSEHTRHAEESRRLHAERLLAANAERYASGGTRGEQPAGDLFTDSGGALESYEAEPFGEVVDSAW